MDVTYDGDHKVILDDRVHIHGINHFSNDAMEEYVDYMREVEPDIFAVEEYKEKFGLTQLQVFLGQEKSEVLFSLVYALYNAIPMALIDIDWSDVEFHEDGIYLDVINNAQAEAGLDDHDYSDATYRAWSDINDAIAEYDPEFFRKFVVERDLAMAARLYWLATETEYETILAPIGIGHVENVVEIMQEIENEQAQTEPTAPLLLSPEDLTDIVVSDKGLADHNQLMGGIVSEDAVPQLRQRYQEAVANVRGAK